jgi:PIN domain nuclease of toxin-antitoxin system
LKAEVPRTKKNARRWRHQPKVRKFNHKELKEGKAMGVFNPEILRIHERNDLQRDPFDRLLIAHVWLKGLTLPQRHGDTEIGTAEYT